MARRMSSRVSGRRDPARVPPAVLRNRILARSRLPVLVVMLAIVYGTAGYWLVEGKNLLAAFYETVLTLSTVGVAAHRLLPAPWFEPGARWSARRVLLHVIAETAQHAGHADIIRESLDGAKSMG